jgi:cell division septum initiation protein DivIVA
MRRQEKSQATEAVLRKENQDLRQQVEDLQELLKHNKNALRASIDFGR